jgi:hypothetical protein
VLTADGWPDAPTESAILEQLLALNRERRAGYPESEAKETDP